ncbi:MAG: GHKL domain-containing protein [Lachnospiraceae bacterium]|nr:GHKL domain-containing protein [Lachnospiraceae bacterium]
MYIVLVAIMIVQGILLMKGANKRRADRIKYENQDRALARAVADNLDLNKRLSDIKYDYDRQQEMADEIQRTQQQIGLLKHDMKNHTLVILSYLEEDKTEEAKRYAGEILDKLNRMYTYVNIGNSLLSYILNSKLSLAKEQGVEIKAEIENLPFSYMDSVDFSSLLNNMLDNAVCAALHSRRKKLEVNIASKKGIDVITVRNSIDGSVLDKNPELKSSKEEPGHGYGIKQIKTIAEKYNGNVDIYENKEMFIISVMLLFVPI